MFSGNNLGIGNTHRQLTKMITEIRIRELWRKMSWFYWKSHLGSLILGVEVFSWNPQPVFKSPRMFVLQRGRGTLSLQKGRPGCHGLGYLWSENKPGGSGRWATAGEGSVSRLLTFLVSGFFISSSSSVGSCGREVVGSYWELRAAASKMTHLFSCTFFFFRKEVPYSSC